MKYKLYFAIKTEVRNTKFLYPTFICHCYCLFVVVIVYLNYQNKTTKQLPTKEILKSPAPTISDERVNFSDSDDMSKHITEPLWIHKVEITEQRVFVV